MEEPSLKSLELHHDRLLYDLEMILNGGFSPLNGFMNLSDYLSYQILSILIRVLEHMKLTDGTTWTIPIVLDVQENHGFTIKERVILTKTVNGKRQDLAMLEIEDIFYPDKSNEALKVFGTNDLYHPGVHYLHKTMGPVYIGGCIVSAIQFPIKILNHSFENLISENFTWS
ncbi:PUA-like protein [Rozella allomycis CSF55]|uniref:PUA-like protein n=1 Tax=Rozella allomycis (strain CSF55) TaxID=988480 RepID=A0A4P9YPI2_ROZAC|nr:PUA-like protein [Rozella allomycis CSF55]